MDQTNPHTCINYNISIETATEKSKTRSIDKYDIIFFTGLLSYFIFFSYLSIKLYHIYYLGRDLAIFNQSLWTTLIYGGLFTNSIEAENISHFAVHFSPILYTLIPIYAIYSHPVTLLIAQNFLLALGAIPIYLCGRKIIGERNGCIIGLIYFIYPLLHGVNTFDFHEIAFLPFFLGMTLLGYVTDNKKLLLIFGLLSLFIKEDISLIIGMISLAGLFQTRSKPINERWQYLVLLGMSIIILLLFIGFLRPMLASEFPGWTEGFIPDYYDPFQNFSQNNDKRIDYFFMTFNPLLFIPFLAPEILIFSFPSFLEIFLSPHPHLFHPSYHYSAMVIPVLFFSTIFGLVRIQKMPLFYGKKIIQVLICLILISSLVCIDQYSPGTYLTRVISVQDVNSADLHSKNLHSIIERIPENLSVSTQINLLPALSNRKLLWDHYNESADIIISESEFFWKISDLDRNQEKIDRAFVQIFNKWNIKVYVNRNQITLQHELNQSLQSIIINHP